MREATIDVRGAKVRAFEAGEGPLVLYLHGADGPRDNPLVTELAKSHRVLMPEIPGFGRAPLPEWMMSVADAALFGLDLVTAVSAAATALGNVGPGLGDIVGPAGNFSPLPAAAKWILSFAMMLGRLELFTVLVLLRPEFWRS